MMDLNRQILDAVDNYIKKYNVKPSALVLGPACIDKLCMWNKLPSFERGELYYMGMHVKAGYEPWCVEVL